MKEQLYWEFKRSTDMNYEWSTIHIFTGQIMKVREMMEGSSGETRDRHIALLMRGYEYYIERSYTWVTFKWQHYKRGVRHPREYCEVEIAIGRHYNDMKRNMRLLEKIIRKVLKMTDHTFVGYYTLLPKPVIAALKKMKAKHVEQHDYAYYRRAA